MDASPEEMFEENTETSVLSHLIKGFEI